MGDPPDGRVVEQDRLGQGLHEVDEAVAAADVGELVSQKRIELGRRQPGGEARGQQDHGRRTPSAVGTSTRADSRSRTG